MNDAHAALTPPSTYAVPTLQRRFAAMLYEGVLLFGVLFLADYLFDTLTQSRNALMYRHARIAYLFAVMGFYFMWFWTHGGQTLPMKTWRIRLVDPGHPGLSVLKALTRYALSWVGIIAGLAAAYYIHLSPVWALVALGIGLALPPCYALVDRDHQFLHDRLLGTRLVTV